MLDIVSFVFSKTVIIITASSVLALAMIVGWMVALRLALGKGELNMQKVKWNVWMILFVFWISILKIYIIFLPKIAYSKIHYNRRRIKYLDKQYTRYNYIYTVLLTTCTKKHLAFSGGCPRLNDSKVNKPFKKELKRCFVE